MKLITLNTWGGRISTELIEFLKRNTDTDIFCFQEVYHRGADVHVDQGGIDPNLNLFDDIAKVLPSHQGYFRPHYLETYGLATFVKKPLSVIDEDDFFIHHHKGFIPAKEIGNHARNVQKVTINTDNESLHIFNVHGLWNGKGKGDAPDRLEQSQKLANYLKRYQGKIVLCGDFNLSPDTISLKMLEELPLHNLVKDYDVTSTRTSFYDKENKFADYILVNDQISVVDFRVIAEEVSDHAPLFLEFK